MTYRELLKLYQEGKLDEEQKQEVEQSVEKQEAISEYLYEKEEIPGLEALHEEEAPPAAIFVTDNINDTMINVTIVKGQLRNNILKNTLTIVMALFKSCGILWLIICLNVSISFV